MSDTNGLMDKPTVLIVDDSPDDIALISELLKDSYKIKIAGNGKRALKVAQTGAPPDMILLDIMMPIMDGYETCRHLKETPETLNIPVIFLTSKTELVDELKGFALGAVDYITKPISPPILLARVQTHLKLKQASDYLKDNNQFLEAEVQRRTREALAAQKLTVKAEKALNNSEILNRRLVEHLPHRVFIKDLNSIYLSCNANFARDLGIAPEEVVGKNDFAFHPVDLAEAYRVDDRTTMEARQIKEFEQRYLLAGQERWIHVTKVPFRDEQGEIMGVLGTFEDITERKRAEQQQQERTKELQAFFTLSELITREGITIEELCREFSAVLPESWQYPEITCARIVIGDTEFRTENFEESGWLQSAPIKVKETVRGRIDVGYLEERPAVDEGPFLKEERMLIDALAERLGHVFGRKQGEEQLQYTLEKLRKSMRTTIQVMVSTVEARDPYTSGHQVRAAGLARAIATEMGLSPDKIDGLRMAGSIHDIGKISIPAEILSKPTKLSELEFAMIKEHAQRGYELLKNVESPWPLAEIVHQHHERMDGSGYPRHLKGEKILIEARILTVADVVEAMASHRPYRPGLGIDAALNEIERHRGTFYDDAVAAACLKLFREKGFQFERS
jgi:PAS domain S-box-containing protein